MGITDSHTVETVLSEAGTAGMLSPPLPPVVYVAGVHVTGGSRVVVVWRQVTPVWYSLNLAPTISDPSFILQASPIPISG